MPAKKKPARKRPAKKPLTVVAAVERDLKDIATTDKRLAESGLAASAMALAREMDANNSATSKSMCAKALNDTLDRLRELAPPKKEIDKLDDLSSRRAKRLARSAAA